MPIDKISKKTFFVTGGAGFIGSNVVEFLINKKAEVIVYDNLQSGNYDFIKNFSDKGMTFIKGSTLDKELLITSLKKYNPNCIIHMAANPIISYSGAVFDEGLRTTFNVLDAMRLSNINHIIFPSSGSVYGNATILPTPESYGPMLPISLYASMKLGSEALICAFNSIYGIDYNIFRLANAVGKNMTHGVAYDFVKKLKSNATELNVLGNGTQKKNYIAVPDILSGIFHVYSNEKYKNNIFNLASSDQISVREIAELSLKLCKSTVKISYQTQQEGWKGDVVDNFISNKRLLDIGFKPTMTSAQAIEYTINLLLKNYA